MSKLNKKQRLELFDKYSGRCAYCGDELVKGWHADHIEPIRRNGDGTCLNPHNEVFDNYNPSCASCNINKHSMSLEEFRKSISMYVESLNKYTVQYKMAKKYGLVVETEKEVKFYFENFDAINEMQAIEFFNSIMYHPNYIQLKGLDDLGKKLKAKED